MFLQLCRYSCFSVNQLKSGQVWYRPLLCPHGFRLQVTYVVSSGLLVAFPVLVVAFVGDPAAASDHPDLITD